MTTSLATTSQRAEMLLAAARLTMGVSSVASLVKISIKELCIGKGRERGREEKRRDVIEKRGFKSIGLERRGGDML